MTTHRQVKSSARDRVAKAVAQFPDNKYAVMGLEMLSAGLNYPTIAKLLYCDIKTPARWFLCKNMPRKGDARRIEEVHARVCAAVDRGLLPSSKSFIYVSGVLESMACILESPVADNNSEG